jgi:hypothetical protein
MAREAEEPELPEPAPMSDWPERQAAADEERREWAARALDRVQDIEQRPTPEMLFTWHYGDETTGRMKEAAMSFLRKAAKAPARVGSVIGFNADAWLIVDEVIEGGNELFVLVPLERVYEELRRLCGGIDKPLLEVEACPRSIARVDNSSKIRRDFVVECSAVHRVGRVPRKQVEELRAEMKHFVSRGEMHFRFDEMESASDLLHETQSLFLERRAATVDLTT